LKLREKDYLVGLAGFNGIGIKRLSLLQHYFNSAQNIWQASEGQLLKTGLNSKLIKDFIVYRQKTDLSSLKIWLEKQLIKTITIDEENYPELLKKITNPPFLIFVKSQIALEKSWNKLKLIAVVGSRQMTSYGQRATQHLVTDLVKRDWLIVSGLARGVDRVAHQAALEAKGQTLAVLGHGLDRVYPVEHRFLAEAIIKQGALLTERAPFSQLEPANFPARNRLIAGLCQGVLVIEGARKSGTKITASFAVDFNREVFAVPGQLDNPMSQAPADLIKLGAKLVYSVEDILEELESN